MSARTGSMSRTSGRSPLGQGGFTLTEVMVAASLSLIVLSGVLAAYLFLGRNLTRLVNAGGQDVKSRHVLRQFTSDVGAAVSFTTINSSNLTFTVPITLTNCTTTAGSTTVTCASTAGLQSNLTVSGVAPAIWGAGIPNNAVVNSVTNATTFVMSATATATTTGATLYTTDGINYSYSTGNATLTRTDYNNNVTTTLLTDIDTSAINGFSYYNAAGATVSLPVSVKEVGFSFATKVGTLAVGTQSRYSTVSPRVVVHNKPILQ